MLKYLPILIFPHFKDEVSPSLTGAGTSPRYGRGLLLETEPHLGAASYLHLESYDMQVTRIYERWSRGNFLRRQETDP
ncbi:MAG: hypothetical protein DDT30_00157 [Dehalococcoidia bacterium]|nr:hypothetical protein [Bacillota bacterium]